MKTTNSGSVSVPFRLDPMSKARMEWIKAQIPEIKPSGSMLLRRALSHYLMHLETILADPEALAAEVTYLKACSSGDSTPWRITPDFTNHRGKAFSLFVRESNQRRINSLFNSDPFGGKAKAMTQEKR